MLGTPPQTPHPLAGPLPTFPGPPLPAAFAAISLSIFDHEIDLSIKESLYKIGSEAVSFTGRGKEAVKGILESSSTAYIIV
jgi:hypothetical protein